MRGTRWLLLLAIAAIIGGIGFKYQAQKKIVREEALPVPQPLPPGLNTADDLYEYKSKNTARGCPTSHITAHELKQISDNSRVDLTQVQLEIYNKQCTSYDLIKSAAATFFQNDHRLYSEGAVQITLNVPLQNQPKHELITIHSSGVTFDTETGRAETDRAATFTFENGEGKATGAFYDPTTHELQLKSGVEVNWKPIGPNAKPMKIEGASLIYHEANAEVQLQPWGKLTRDNTVVEGENVVIHLQETGTGDQVHRFIKELHTVNAHGTDVYPNRNLQYSANDLQVNFDGAGEIQQMIANTNAHLVSTSEASATTVDANHVQLDFTVQNKQSLLSHVDANGNAVVSSKPLPVKGQEPAESHVLRSAAIDMKMRPGGRDLESVQTHAPGTLEFLPNLPAQRHRLVTAGNMQIAYGPANHIDSFHAGDVKTSTDPNAEERKKDRAVSTTASKELVAHFDPKTNKLATMEQTGDFTYAEGDRRARARKASLDSDQNIIILDTGARMWDSTGATSADRIRMDQRSGDFTADGNVESSRMPDQNSQKKSQMLSGDEPLQAQARRMVSTNRNTAIHYDGKVVMWQGANRISAETIDVDRKKKTLIADGGVVSNLWQDSEPKTGTATAKPAVLTVVKAPHLAYTDDNRLAIYSGGVNLNRPDMHLQSRELHAFLADSTADSRLEKAFADGAVEIVQTTVTHHTYTGTADHTEYYCDDNKVVLKSEKPRMARLVDSVKGHDNMTQAPELTYLADDGRLLGSGGSNQPVQSRIQRGRK
jgi:lipopolysaccharide export system protein LptA